jgi:hypothetical protein
MAAAFDKAAFRAKAAEAAKAAAEVLPVTLPGIGACWVRPLTFGDEMEATAARQQHEAAGVTLSRALLSAMRLAQNLCDEAGAAIFDITSLEDLQILAALPTDQVADALIKAGEVDGGKRAPKG